MNYMQILNQFAALLRLNTRLYYSPQKLKLLQVKLMRLMIHHAYKSSRFYNQKFKHANIHPEQIKTTEDLRKIPLTTKKELMKYDFQDLVSNTTNLSQCHVSRTSGSTGTNFSIAYDQHAYAYERALSLRANLSCGQRFYDKQLTIDRPTDVKTNFQWFQKLRIFPLYHTSIFQQPQEIIQIIDEIKPDILYGFSSSIWNLAKCIINNDLEILPPKLVFTTAEVLDQKMRSDISKAFGCDVLDQFGCVEMGRTAWECPAHSGYHMDIDSFIFEIEQDAQPVDDGSQGELIYTNLYNYSMPLIRYQVGDIAVKSSTDCICNRPFPVLSKILGRKDDFIIKSDGSTFPPILFAVFMKYQQGVKSYRIVQESQDFIRVLITIDDKYSKQTENQIIAGIRDLLNESIQIEIEITEEIQSEMTGKIRSVISKVAK